MRAVNDTVPIALEIFGTGHHIRGNIVGLDADDPEDDPTGVCGQGIKVSGSANLILDNTIARSHTSLQGSQGGPLNGAILFSDNSLTPGGIAVRRNRVIDGPGNIYVFGPE